MLSRHFFNLNEVPHSASIPAAPKPNLLVTSGLMTEEQISALKFEQRLNVETPAVQELVTNGKLKLDRALNLTEDQRLSLNNEGFCKVMEDNKVELEEILKLGWKQLFHLRNPEIQNLVTKKQIPLNEVLTLTEGQFIVLSHPEIRGSVPIETILSLDDKKLLDMAVKYNEEHPSNTSERDSPTAKGSGTSYEYVAKA